MYEYVMMFFIPRGLGKLIRGSAVYLPMKCHVKSGQCGPSRSQRQGGNHMTVMNIVGRLQSRWGFVCRLVLRLGGA